MFKNIQKNLQSQMALSIVVPYGKFDKNDKFIQFSFLSNAWNSDIWHNGR
jgi:hypothetical protein